MPLRMLRNLHPSEIPFAHPAKIPRHIPFRQEDPAVAHQYRRIFTILLYLLFFISFRKGSAAEMMDEGISRVNQIAARL